VGFWICVLILYLSVLFLVFWVDLVVFVDGVFVDFTWIEFIYALLFNWADLVSIGYWIC